MDTLPIPAYHLYPNSENYDKIPLDVGRGCPYDCIYCSTAQFWKRKYRLKSVSRILKEIEFLKSKYPGLEFWITHDFFTLNKKRVVEFCNALIERRLDINWRCYGRTDMMDSVLLEKMAEAGSIRIFYGIESGSAKMQRYIEKNLEIVSKYPRVFPSFYSIKPRYLDLKMLAVVQDALNNFPWTFIAIRNELGDSLKIFKFKFKNWNSCLSTEEKSFYRYVMNLILEGKLKTAYLKDLLEYENIFCLLAKEKFEGKPKSKSDFEFEKKVEINGNVVIKEFDYDIKEVISSLKQKHSSMQIMKIKKELCIIMFYKKGYMSVKTSRINIFTKELIELCNKNRNYSVRDVVNEMVTRSYNKDKCVDALKNLYKMGMIGLN